MSTRHVRLPSLASLLVLGSLLVLLLGSAVPAAASAPYVRYPDIHGERIVFCAEGDLWVVSDQGGQCRRLTVHPGTEYFPAFSPDGEQIAFTGVYDGNQDVFVIPAAGGEPLRLTWHPAADEVVGWTPDGRQIIFRSYRESPMGDWELFTVPAAGGDATKLPLGWAARLDIDPQTGLWAFNRKSWETATWKRYRGGTAPDIWVGDPQKADFRVITDFSGLNAFPMWHGGRIWFLSDQGGTANIWSILPDGGDRRRHTDFSDWDARWPSMGPDGRIVFTLAADIQLFDPADGKVRKVEVQLPSDRVLTRVRYPDPGQTITWFELAPEGDRLALVTRGEIFSVPAKAGVTLPVSRGTGARESWAGYDPKGEKLVYVSDATGEEEIRVVDAWGRGEEKTILPAKEGGWHYPPRFSPDGKWIAWSDQSQSLFVMPAEGGTPREVDHSGQREIREYEWSPDGRWLAYSKVLPTDYSSLFLYDTKEGKSHRLTGPYTSDGSPAWDPDGRYLYFVSDRATNPLLGNRDWNNVESKNNKLYMLLLRKDVKNPLAALEGLPPTEEEKAGEGEKGKGEDKAAGGEKEGKDKAKGEKEGKDDGKDGEKKEGKKKWEPPKPVEIDLEGLPDRLVELPVPHGLYFGLGATATHLFYVSAPLKGMAELPAIFEEPEPDSTLMAFELEKKEAKPFLEGVSGFSLAPGAKKIAVMKKRGEIFVLDAGAPPGPDMAQYKVALDGVVVELDPLEEWRQIYFEGWRLMREFYWDSGMGGLDWKEVRDRYAKLLPRLALRDDLRNLMGEVIGELATSHTYVFGGDPGVQVSRVSTGLLGADLEREGSAYRVKRIYRGDPADGVRSPLAEPEAGVAEGEYILAVNHRPFDPRRPFHASLAGRAGKAVVLTVNGQPTAAGARDVVVLPLPSEEELRYADWVRRNREYVAGKTGGRIGYLHIPDMWNRGLIAFNTWFYPQLDREGLIVDARWNGGGSVSQMIVECLRRRVISFDRARGGGVSSYPYRSLNGPFVVLTNEFAGSDGDIFPMAIQLEKLAPVIGMRSWGGVVGIRGDKRLVDGGMLTQPEFAWWDPQQGWALENRGVVPDIEVQNLPQDLARGVDTQLDRGIAEVLRLHGERPPVEAQFGPVRDRSRKGYGAELGATR